MTVHFREAPIVGEEGCVRFTNDGHLIAPAAGWLNTDGFSFLLDFQADSLLEQIVFGARETDGSTIVFIQHSGGTPNKMRIEVGDGQGRGITAEVVASDSHGKRIQCSVFPRDARVELFELHPWGSSELAEVGYLRQTALDELRPLTDALTISGCRTDAGREGSFVGRIAHFALFDDAKDRDTAMRLRDSSVTRASDDLPLLTPGAVDQRGRELLLDDYEKLGAWAAAASMSAADTRDASVVAYRWLCDRTPLLVRAANQFGVQVSFPDLDPMRAYTAAVTADKPIFLYHRDRWEGRWLPRSAFLSDMAFWLGSSSRSVSWEAFIKFVRNKLGGGHFDPDDRKRWHEEFEAMIRETRVGGEQWIHVKMQVLARALTFAAESCGLIPLLRAMPD